MMRKIILTEKGINELNKINTLIEELDDYNKLTPNQQFLADIGIYCEGGYIENKFENIEDYIKNSMLLEFNSKYVTPKNIKTRTNKIKKHIKENICQIIEI
jgi:hypothetical protein